MTNAVTIYGRNMDVSDRLNDYVAKKVSRLDRFLPGIDEARVDLAYVRSARSAMDRQVAQITVRGKKFILRAEERAEDIFVAFDQALDKIQRRMERYKGKRNRGRGDGKTMAEIIVEDDEVIVGDDDNEGELLDSENRIVRRKKFQLEPMDEQEAIEQMEMLGHENFFVFYNMASDAVNVVYRRRDGTYGLIEPEMA